MRRHPFLLVCGLLVLGLGLALAWTLLGWPPPRLVLKYGIPPYCAPTGREINVEGIEFVEIGPGCFRMGSEYLAAGGDSLGRLCATVGLPWGDQPKPSNEMPVHWVEFSQGFWIARTEVTNAHYERFDPGHERPWTGDFPPRKAGDQHPAVRVSWEDARSFCAWISELSGRDIRLPSEAMWEAACRGGSEGEFCFGDDEGRLGEYAWCEENSVGGTHEVGTRRANHWGLHDLHGNVWEWCEDAYHKNYEGAPRDGSAWSICSELKTDPLERVCRGGASGLLAAFCRCASRDGHAPESGNTNVGFRPCIWPSGD